MHSAETKKGLLLAVEGIVANHAASQAPESRAESSGWTTLVESWVILLRASRNTMLPHHRYRFADRKQSTMTR